MEYKHTQIGYLMIYITVIILALFGLTFFFTGYEPQLFQSQVIILIMVILILGSFSTLNVVIDKNYLRIKFGYGIFQKKFLLSDIVSAKTVKNEWYYGFGIRFILWPRMIIFNVSGYDAVEIIMKNMKIYRIGTDEPKELEQAILTSIKKKSSKS